jgi:hypothetical protein
VFPGLTQERLRTAISRACKASGTPTWSPHDLRHRRISLWPSSAPALDSGHCRSRRTPTRTSSSTIANSSTSVSSTASRPRAADLELSGERTLAQASVETFVGR